MVSPALLLLVPRIPLRLWDVKTVLLQLAVFMDGALDASPETDADYSTKHIYHLLRPATRTWRGNTSSS